MHFAPALDATPEDFLLHLHTHLTLGSSCALTHALLDATPLRRRIFSCTCTHTWHYPTRSSLVLAHALDVTPQYLLLHLHTHLTRRRKILCHALADLMLCHKNFSCTCTRTWRYATSHSSAHALVYATRSFALAHARDATPWNRFRNCKQLRKRTGMCHHFLNVNRMIQQWTWRQSVLPCSPRINGFAQQEK